MKNRKLTYLLLLDVFVASIALVFILVAMWNRPLGPSLAASVLPTTQGQNNSSLPVANQQGEPAEATTIPQTVLAQIATDLAPKTPTPVPLCGGPSVMYVLLIGSDARSGGYRYGLADTIRLVRIDFTSPEVTMLDFPRDLWVEIPGISDHYDITHAKLNQAYFFGNPGMGYYDGPGEGPGLTAQTLQLNFGAQVDHYLAMDMNTFARVVDAVDGIDLHFDTTLDLNEGQDEANPDIVYHPGDYHLDGTEALQIARDRFPTIFQRARYQTMVLKALERKLLNPAMIPAWPQIIADFTRSVQTDLSPSDISELVCLGQLLTSDKITTVAFPEEMFASARTYDPYREVYTFTFDVDNIQLRAYVADFMDGTWPVEP